MKRPAKLLYQVNKLSYSLMLIHIVAIVSYLIVVLVNMDVNLSISFVALSNVILMLFAFLVAVRIKVYDHRYQYVPLFLALYQALQILFIPSGIEGKNLYMALAACIIAALCAIASSIISIYKNKIRSQVIKDQNTSKSSLAN